MWDKGQFFGWSAVLADILAAQTKGYQRPLLVNRSQKLLKQGLNELTLIGAEKTRHDYFVK